MKFRKSIAALGFTIASTVSSSVFADCQWTTTSLNAAGGNFSISFSCRDNGDTWATKSVTVPAVGNPTCSVTPEAGYFNAGTCNSPDIKDGTNPFPVNVVNGKTEFCNVRSVAGGNNFEVKGIKCPNHAEAFVVKSYGNFGSCSIAIDSSSSPYRVSGSCNNYTIRKK